MIAEWIPYLLILGIIWFIVYWIVGGVLFALVAFSRVTKLRRALFSTLFTIESFLLGLLVAFAGTYSAEEQIATCVAESQDIFGDLASVIACGVLEHMVAGFIGFIVLIIAGLLTYFASRATNQSWLDSDVDEDRQEQVFF